jgi:hypothetical protein
LPSKSSRVRWWGGVRWRGWVGKVRCRLDMLQHVNTPTWLDTPSQVKSCSSWVEELTGMKIFWACVKIFLWGWVMQLKFKHAKVSCQSDRTETVWCVTWWAQANAWHACMSSSSNWELKLQQHTARLAVKWNTLSELANRKVFNATARTQWTCCTHTKHNYSLVMFVLSLTDEAHWKRLSVLHISHALHLLSHHSSITSLSLSLSSRSNWRKQKDGERSLSVNIARTTRCLCGLLNTR